MHLIKKNITFFLVFIFSCLLNTYAFSQKNLTQTQIDSILKERWDFRDILSKYLISGPEIIEVIKKSCPHEIDSMIVAGKAKMKKQQWKKANAWFELCLQQEPDNLHANYGYAICKREIGKRTILLTLGQYINWRSSQKHFERVIALDSSYKDVFYQYAILEEYREHYHKTIQLIQTHISLNGLSHDLQIELFRLYDTMIHRISFEDAETWLRSRNLKYDNYFLGELYRINGQFGKADSIFQRLLFEPGVLPTQKILLSLVRLCVQNEKPEKAEDYYWVAVNMVSNKFQKDLLLEDFMYIVNEKEYDFLKSDRSLNMLSKALNVFWLRRDPLPSLPYNPRLIEHYRRVIYAEEHFRYEGPRHKLYKGDKINMLDFPKWYYENHKLNDKGLIYVRFGRPDKKATFIGESIQDSPFYRSAVLPEKISQNMSWLYLPRGDTPKMIFHFVIPEDSPPGYWTLVPGFVIPPESLEQMVGWDHRYYSILTSDTKGQSYSIMHNVTEERADMVHQALRTDRHTWPDVTDTLNMSYTIDRFRQSKQKDIVQLTYAIPLSGLFDKDSQRDSIHIETGITIFGKGATPILDKIHHFGIKDTSDSHIYHNLFIDEFECPLTLNRYNITLHGRIPGMNQLNGWRFNYTLTDSARDKLGCSTLKLAFHISPKKEAKTRNREELTIIPNPTNTFSRIEPLYMYYEVYNLTFDDKRSTNYTVNFKLKRLTKSKKNIVQGIVGIFGGEKNYQVSVESDQTGKSRIVTDYIRFGTTHLKEGTYNLRLRIKDNVSGQEISTDREIALY